MGHWSDEYFDQEDRSESDDQFKELTIELFTEVWWRAQAFKWMTKLAALLGIDWPAREG